VSAPTDPPTLLAPRSSLHTPLDNDFDVVLANRLAHFEAYNKHLYRPNSYLHKWWARRCGSTFRLILKHLVADEKKRDYYRPGGLEGKVILDPMMGGGTTLHEAIRLGANVIGADIDPIPVLQARATLADIPLATLEAAFNTFHDGLRQELEPYFTTSCPTCAQPSPLRFVLYGLRRTCACGPAVLVDSLLIRQDKDGITRLCPTCWEVVQEKEREKEKEQGFLPLSFSPSPSFHPCTGAGGRPPLVEKHIKHCPVCREAYQEEAERPYYQRYVPLAIFGQCPRHRLFVAPPAEADLALIAQAEARVGRGGQSVERGVPEAWSAADFVIEAGPKSIDLVRRGIHNYLELFTGRQLLYLRRAIQLLPQFEPLLQLNLALLVSTSLEFNSLLCGYKGTGQRRPGAIRHTFSLHAYSFPYTALENNPLYARRASGTLPTLFHDRIQRGRQWANRPVERRIINSKSTRTKPVEIKGEVDAGTEVIDAAELRQGARRFLLVQGSSACLPLEANSVDYVVTDPPYFDSVQYGDLAAFFRVWLRQMLPDGAQWHYGLDLSAVNPHHNGTDQYTAVISAIFAECHRVLRKESGRLIFTFHHWNPRGWAALTLALRRAGFVLLNRYVVQAENPISVHIAGMRALLHDAILVLAPAETGLQPQWERPVKVNTADSQQFTRDCATLLGWMLTAGVEDDAIVEEWKRELGD
jgi:putative DNA methylase